MRTLAAILLFIQALPAAAQFTDLAIDRSGRRILFSTPLTLKGEENNNEFKLIEADQTRKLRTYLSVKAEWLPGDRAPLNFPSLRSTVLSSDGQTVAWTATRACAGGSGCLGVERLMGTIRHGRCAQGERCETAAAGWARLSANGRWAAFAGPQSMARQYGLKLLDLDTGASSQWMSPPSGISGAGRRSIANDGTLVTGGTGPGLLVFRAGAEPVQRRTTWNLTEVVVSDDARFAVGQTLEANPSLVAVELATGWETVLIQAAEGCRKPALTEDGTVLMFLSGANWEGKNDSLAVQVWTADLITGRLRQWTFEPAGVLDAAISGDGMTVVAATAGGRLIAVDGLSLETSEIARGTDAVSQMPAQVARGSRYELTGAGLDQAELAWKDRSIQPVSISANRIEFIFPWDAEMGEAALVVSGKGSQFEPQSFTARLSDVAPYFISANYRISGLRPDGSEISDMNPVRPGEAITLRMAGLGPVDSQGRVLTALEIYDSSSGGGPIEILSARADPDKEGRYLITARVPGRTYLYSPVSWVIRAAGSGGYSDTGNLPIATQ